MSPVDRAAATNSDPDPAVDAPLSDSTITLGETVQIVIEGRNNGGPGGQYSSISVSSPSLDESDDDAQAEVVSTSLPQTTTRTRGDQIYTRQGDPKDADYLLVEASTGQDGQWESGEEDFLTVDFTPEETGTFVIYTRVTLSDDSDPDRKFTAPSSSSYRDQQDYSVRRYEVEVREESDIDARLTDVDHPSGTYRGDDSVPVTATVENTGNREHTFFVGYSTVGPDGEYYDNHDTTGRTVQLRPGEDRTISMEWDVEDGAPDGSYDSLVSVWEESDRDNLQNRLDRSRENGAFTVEHVDPDARITSFDTQSGTFQPGEDVRSSVSVENTGNAEHTFFVGYSAVGPDGNEYNNDGTTGRTVTLDPGEERRVDVSWTVEEDAPAGDYDLRASVWEETDRDNLRTRLDDERRSDVITVERDRVDAEVISFRQDSGTYQTGDTVRATATVENTGNVEHTFFVGYSAIDSNGDSHDNGGTTGTSVTLAPGEQRTIDLGWSVEEDAPTGTYDAVASIWKENDRDDLHTRLDRAKRTDAFDVAEATDIDATIRQFDVESGAFEAGEKVDATAVVENTGNREHTFFVGYSVVSPDGASHDNGGSTGRPVTLAPGERRTVDIEWEVEDDAPTGTYDAVASVWKESDRDNLQTRLDRAERTDAFDVVEPTEIDATVRRFDPQSGTFSSGQAVEASVTVENTGNTEHTFFVGYSAVSPDGTYYDDDGRTGRDVTLAPGEVRSITVSWTIPDQAASGEYDLITSVWERRADGSPPENRLDTARQRDAVSVADGSVSISAIELTPEQPSPRSDVTASVQLTNDGERDLSEVEIQVRFNGETERSTLSLPDGASETIEFGLQTGSAESTELTVTAVTETGETAERSRVVDVSSSASLEGRVADASGDPISGVTVQVAEKQAETDENGRFSLQELPSGEQEVRLDTGETTTTRRVRLRAGEQQSVQYRIGGSGRIASVDAPVTYRSGSEIGVSVVVENTGERRRELTVTSALPAEFEPASQAEERSVSIAAGSTREVDYRLNSADSSGEQTLRFGLRDSEGTLVDEETATVRQQETELLVKVIDTNGAPVEGVDIGLGTDEKRPHETDADGVTTVPLTAPDSDSFGYDDSGEWSVLLDYNAPEYGVKDFRSVEVSAGRTNRVTIQLPARARVSGQVVAGDEPLNDVQVRVGDHTIRTTENGRFELAQPISRGNYYIVVKKNDEVIMRDVYGLSKGFNRLQLSVDQARYDSATGGDQYVEGVVTDIFDDDADEVYGQIYGEVEGDATVSAAPGGVSTFYTTENGAYYTTGPCAWYSTEERCEESQLKLADGERNARAFSRGTVTGFVYGGEETINGFKELLKPIQYLSELIYLAVSIARDLGLLEELLAAIPAQLKKQQRADNPYTPGSESYESFEEGWYSGYGAFILVSSVVSGGVGSTASKALSSSSKFSKVAKKANGLSDGAKSRIFRRHADDVVDETEDVADGLDEPGDVEVDKQLLDQAEKLRIDGADGITDNIQQFRQSGDLSRSEAQELIDALDRLEGTDGTDRLGRKLAKSDDPGEFSGYAYEATFAKSLLDDGNDVLEIRKPSEDFGDSVEGDVDVLAEKNGQTVGYEVKSWRWSNHDSASKKDELIEQLKKLKNLEEEGHIDEAVLASKEPAPMWVRTLAEDNGIKVNAPETSRDLAKKDLSYEILNSPLQRDAVS